MAITVNGAMRREVFDAPRAETVSSPSSRDLIVDRIECALAMMLRALTLGGFSEHEAGSINLSTRAAITDIIKNRGRRSS